MKKDSRRSTGTHGTKALLFGESPTSDNTSVFLCGTLVLQHLRLHPLCLRFFKSDEQLVALRFAPHVGHGGEARGSCWRSL